MWAAQYYKFENQIDGLLQVDWEQWAMASAAIGAQVANPDALVIDKGDASISMNIQEMSTAVQYRLPVKIFF